MYRERVLDYLPEFVDALKKQLRDDEERWGDTWKKRPREGQTERIQNDYRDYFERELNGGEKVNWLKVIGNALIAWIREFEEKPRE